MKIIEMAVVMMVSGAIAVGCSAGVEPAADEAKEAKPETTETVSEALEIGNTHDKCSSSSLYVLNQSNTYQFIPHDGLWHYVDVASRRFTWLCNGSNEWTTCNYGTTYVYARHQVGSSTIDWSCQQ